MHRILLREVVIDVPAEQLTATRDFWAGALLARPRLVERATEFTAMEEAAVAGLRRPSGRRIRCRAFPSRHRER